MNQILIQRVIQFIALQLARHQRFRVRAMKFSKKNTVKHLGMNQESLEDVLTSKKGEHYLFMG
jgi:hypothetical protein